MNELDQMKEKWAEYGRGLKQNIRLNRRLLTTIHLEAGRSRLQRLLGFAALHSLAWLACVVALGRFLYEHFCSPRFTIAALAVDLYAIGMLIALIRQMFLVGAIDYAQPVAMIQKRLQTVRLLRIRTTQWAVLIGTFVWTPFLIVASQAFLGVDACRLLGKRWFVANALFGLALIPLEIWTSKKFGCRMSHFPILRRIMNDLAGENLTAAISFLEAVSEFQSEGDDHP